ncbi:MAG: cell division topological specificity factor MinE [Armatimonadota bacterium]
MAISFLERLLGKKDPSQSIAKDRLKLVLMHDRADLPAAVLDQMRGEMLEVLRKYVEIDESELNVALEREDNTVALVANIPIRRVRTP